MSFLITILTESGIIFNNDDDTLTINGINFNMSSGILDAHNCNISNSVVSGGADFDALVENGNINGGHNVGWRFGALRTLYWVGEGGNWSDTGHWSLSSGGEGGEEIPTSVDNVIFDSNSITSEDQTIYFPTDEVSYLSSLDMTDLQYQISLNSYAIPQIVSKIACGYATTMVLTENGDVHGWGENWVYQVNPNSTDDPWLDPNTVIFSGVKDISCGETHTMVLMENGDVHGWGENWDYRINYNSSDEFWTDQSTVFMSGVKSIVCGSYHTMVLMENGDVHGWGSNWSKQVNPISDDDVWIDPDTVLISGVKQIAGGGEHTMVLMENGDVHGWGRNDNKQVNPNSDDTYWIDPSTVIFSGVKEISCGYFHTMVLMENGDVHGWGDNRYRNVNPLSDINPWVDATSTIIISGVKQISCNFTCTMAVMENGDVHGWGGNFDKNVNPLSDITPWIDTSTVILSGVKQIVCGSWDGHTMAVMENGDVHGWGKNDEGEANPYDSTTSPWTDATSLIPLSTSLPWEISVSSGIINAFKSLISNSIASGGATFNAFEENDNTDGGNNTGWNFGNRTRYWVSNNPQWTYDFYDSANWSYTSGGPGGSSPPSTINDTAVFDANSVYGIGQANMYQIEIYNPLVCHIRIDSDCSAIAFYLYSDWSLQEDMPGIGAIMCDYGSILNTNDFDITLSYGFAASNSAEVNLGSSILTIRPVEENNLDIYITPDVSMDSSMATLNIDFVYNCLLYAYANSLNFADLIVYGDGRIYFLPYNAPIITTTIGSCTFEGDTEGGLYLYGGEVGN